MFYSFGIVMLMYQLLGRVFSQPSTTAKSASEIASSLSSECISFISAYPPTISLYASQICQVCQNLNVSPSVEPCCADNNPTACFASSFYGITVTDATVPAPITTSAASLGSVNCDAVLSIDEACEAATPGFNDLCFHDQQSCLCSTSGTWAPSYYDDLWSNCLGWASTAAPESYSLLVPSTGRVQSRKCQTYAALTATGGTPSNCMTVSSRSLTTSSLASLGPSGLSSSSSSGFALDISKPKDSDMVLMVVVQVIITVYVVLT